MKLLTIILASLVSYVNPFIGTGYHGHTFPGAAWPFGMVQLSPDTRAANWHGTSGYHYSDSVILGFSHTHLSGTGISDWCDIRLMPIRNYPMPAEGDSTFRLDEARYRSSFSHDSEMASPGWYHVLLKDHMVSVDLTVGRRTGQHRYTYYTGLRSKGDPQVLIDLQPRDKLLDGNIIVDPKDPSVVYGFRRSSSWSKDQMVYFYIQFSSPVSSFAIGDGCAILNFAYVGTDVLEASVSISSTSADGARLNMITDEPMDFDTRRLLAAQEWESYLSTMKCPFKDEDRRKIFYTALYHTAIHPTLYSDADGSYRGMDRKVHKTDGFDRYTVFSLWDTFRGLHPLLCKVAPELTAEFIKTFLTVYNEAGKLPVWELSGYETNCMIGYHSAPVIAEALLQGITDFDVKAALQALVRSSNDPEYGLAEFRRNGVVQGNEIGESVSRTLEFAYDDWCVAQVAKYLAEHAADDAELEAYMSIYEKYMETCQNWRNIFDPSVGFVRPRINGRWLTPFDPREINNHFSEGNAWQYSFLVPHDVAGLMRAMGGPTAFCEKLDTLFDGPSETTGRKLNDVTGLIGQYAHGNEPSHHVPYLYALAGKPEKTEARVKRIMETMYSNAPDGLCGNDDCGQMSAWYILSAVGEYPVCPGAPLGSVTCVPKTIIVNPVFEMESDVVKDKMEVGIGNIDTGCVAWYRIGGTGEFKRYSKPFTIHGACRLECYSQHRDGRKSFVTVCNVSKAD